jgi:hypothetical protein
LGRRRLFLHFFDLHFLEEVVSGARDMDTRRQIVAECRLAMRLALLFADQTLIPASSFHEHPICREVVEEFLGIADTGLIRFVGGAVNMQTFAASKIDLYRPGSPQRVAYEAAAEQSSVVMPFLQRPGLVSTTEELRRFWVGSLSLRNFPEAVFGTAVDLPLGLERRWEQLPERLGAEAFTPEYVAPLVLGTQANPLAVSRLYALINEGYFSSYADAFDAGFVTDLVFLNSRHRLTSAAVSLPFTEFREALRRRGALARVHRADPVALVNLRQDPDVRYALAETLHGELDLDAVRELTLLDIEPDFDRLAADILRIPSGKRDAHRYHAAVERLLTPLFRRSLTDPQTEHAFDDGTRRPDIVYRNVARGGFFQWAAAALGTVKVVVECKNYKTDVANRELDQTLSYLAPWRGRLAIIATRQLRNRALFIKRCRHAVQRDAKYVIALNDDDLVRLAAMGSEPDGGQTAYLYAKIDELSD